VLARPRAHTVGGFVFVRQGIVFRAVVFRAVVFGASTAGSSDIAAYKVG